MIGMSWIRWVVLVGLLLGGSFVWAEEAAPGWNFRTVTGQVLDPEGKPASGVVVSLVGLERDAISQLLSDETAEKWKMVTDREGQFTMRFGDFRSYDYEQATKQWVPGWGAFHFVAECKGTAGGVSPYLQNEGSDDQVLSSLPCGEYDEWRMGEFEPVDLSKQPARVVIRLKRGITVFGKVTDAEGNPLAGQGVRIEHDLHAGSHTGHGGEILFSCGVTDQKGCYRIEHVYPNRFYLNLEESSPLFWYKTRLRNGPWVESRVDEVQPGKDEKEVQVDLIAVKEAPYRYSGKITDADGRGIPGAKVTLSISLHWPVRTHEDTHTHQSVETGKDGTYTFYVASPYVLWFSAEVPGFARVVRAADEKRSSPTYAPLTPGTYDFQVTKKE